MDKGDHICCQKVLFRPISAREKCGHSVFSKIGEIMVAIYAFPDSIVEECLFSLVDLTNLIPAEIVEGMNCTEAFLKSLWK